MQFSGDDLLGILQLIPDPIIVADEYGNFRKCIGGDYTTAMDEGHPMHKSNIAEVLPPPLTQALMTLGHAALADGQPRRFNLPLTLDVLKYLGATPMPQQDQHYEVMIAVLPDLPEGPRRVAVILKNVTTYKVMEEKLREQALVDDLTGLGNRRKFYAEFGSRLRGRDGFGLLMMDLDGFKTVNDTRGHAVGDLVLRQFADWLRGLALPSEALMRLGGDEFALLSSNTDPKAIHARAEELCRLLSNARFGGADLSLGLGISIGATLIAPKEDATRAMARADMALYEAKRRKGNAACYLFRQMQGMAVNG